MKHTLFSSLFFILLLGLFPLSTNAQEAKKVSDFQEDFTKFKNSIYHSFDDFTHQNDSIFIQFISDSWKELHGVQNKVPITPKPVRQPEVDIQISPEKPVKTDTVKVHLISDKEHVIPVKKDAIPPNIESFFSGPTTSLNFYGTEILVPLPGPELPSLLSLSKEGIIKFFSKAASYPLFTSLILRIKTSAMNCRLNDWGLTSMLMLASKKIYDEPNEQVLLTWYGLIRNGIDAKVGYDNERVYLLLPTNEKIYSVSYLINDTSFYLFDGDLNTSSAERLSIYEADYPGNRNNFSFLITEIPQLGNQFVTKTIGNDISLRLEINKNLIDFYRNYPICDLKLFFEAPISKSILEQLDNYFTPILKDISDEEKVAFLLNFVQYSIKYQTDQLQFGREKYLFADETLFYPAADCEDRAILLSKLIKHFTKFETIGLLYPEHVSLAVNINDKPDLKYFTYHNKHFYNCDPTYLGAKCGTIMPKLLSLIPEIIE